MNTDHLDALIQQLIYHQTLIQATLSNPRQKPIDGPHKIIIRPVQIKGKQAFQISTYFGQKVIHKNHSDQECEQILKTNLQNTFKQGLICSKEADYQILSNKKHQPTILKHPPTKTTTKSTHNRQKKYLLQEGVPVPFLVELGVMNREGKVYPKKQNKFRQIHQFLERIDHILPFLDQSKPITIVDFGCGKSYLTFAVYHYLQNVHGISTQITGLDLKADVIQFCQTVANQLNYSHLHFKVGDINEHQPHQKVDMVITLHACDTATDAALEKAVQWNADVILAVPCCQHELFQQVQNTHLTPLLKHGILKERFAALATDAARAQLLTILGYSTQVLEFIETEHTPKNLLIQAVRTQKKRNTKKAIEEYLAFKNALHLSPSLEKRFHNTHLFQNSVDE